jgi:uncharacterized protein (DUF697 family)
MMEQVHKVVSRTSVVAGAIAAVLSPVPMADEIAFVPVLGIMASRIGKAHGLAARDIPWRPIAQTTLATLTARATINVAVAYIPGVAAVANAVTAFAMTRFLGGYIDGACANPAAAHPLSMREVSDRLKESLAGGRRAAAT